MEQRTTTASHWGMGEAVTVDGKLLRVEPDPRDPSPSDLLRSMAGMVYSDARVRVPSVREGFLAGDGGAGRGQDGYVPVSWDEALDLAAREIGRVRETRGNEAIFAGSYGWASAGRFHHAQSQVHRFMNAIGGYVRSVDNYSFAAALVITPHVVGPLRPMLRDATTWPVVAKHGELVVMFGGVPPGNMQIVGGGQARHRIPGLMRKCLDSGVKFITVGPQRSDADAALDAEWIAPRPNTDTALMLGLAHTLLVEDLHDEAFLARYTVGWDRFRPYLTGEADGVAKSAEWAAAICDLPADTIRNLARRMAAQRTLILCAASLQRADHGEQPIWMTVVLAAMLGQVGLPGGGFGLCYGCNGIVGQPVNDYPWPSLPQGRNPVASFIPVARITDMLLEPGGAFDYDGREYAFPDIGLVYWAGGNPFHHHQDLARLREAFRRPEAVIVNEISWTATARHADIVFPVTSTLERDDIAMSRHDERIVAMKRAVGPVGEARNDFDVFSGICARLGASEAFTEGLDAQGWLERLWDEAREVGAAHGIPLPDFADFWEAGSVDLPEPPEDKVLLAGFRDDPEVNRLPTPSGRIEIFSETIQGFGYEDCPGHPVWRAPYEWLGSVEAKRHPLHLVTAQPITRLHGQLDDGEMAQRDRVGGREPITLHPADAAARGLVEGDSVNVFNDRGACRAGLRISPDIRPGTAVLRTGAWFAPGERRNDPDVLRTLAEVGNPNLLTRDKGTSRLGQGTSAQTTLVQVEKFREGG